MTAICASEYQSILEHATGLNVILLPDFTIAAVSNSYLEATLTNRNNILGHDLFEIFPDNPDDVKANGSFNLRNSLNYVVKHKETHTMAVQRYDIRRQNGTFEVRYWNTINTPVLDESKELLYIIVNVTDVTCIYNTENKLKKSEQDYELLVNSVKDYAIFMVDLDGCIASWNSGAAAIKGYSASEIIGKPIDIFYTAQDLEYGIPLKNLKAAAEHGHYESEGWRLRKDGSPFWANIIFTALKDDEGILYGYSKITRDITERKKTLDQLELLSRKIDQSNDSIYTTDDNRNILSWNRGAEKLYGFTETEMMGKEPNAILKTVLSKQEMDDIIKNVGEKHYWTAELKRTKKDGTDIWVRSTLTSILDDSGIITGYLATSFDITEKNKLREQVIHLADIVEQSSEAIFSRGTDQKIISWNKGAEKLFGFSKEEVIGSTAEMLKFIRLASADISAAEKRISETGSWKADMEFFHKDGSSFFGTVTGNLIKNESGVITSFYFIVKDISLQRQLAQQLLKVNEELEEKVKERTEEISKSENKYRLLFENNPLPMWVIDLQTFKFLDVNEMAILQYGYSRDEFLSMTAVDIRPDEDQERFKNTDHTYNIHAIDFNRGTWRHRKKNGTVILVEIIAHQIIFEGREARLILANDVTENKKAEQKLIASEKRFRALLENSTDIISMFDENFNIIYRSRSAARITGWSDEEVLHKRGTGNIHPEDRQEAESIVKKIMAIPGKPFYYSFRMLHKKGHYLFVEGVLTNLLHMDSVNAVVFNFRDITERKSAEEKLVSSEKRFRALLENSSDIISMFDENLNVIYRSKSATRITGWSDEEAMNKNGVNYIHPDDYQVAENIIREAIANQGKTFNYSVRILHKDGHYLFVEGVVTNLLHIEAVKAIVFNLRDITERKSAEEKLVSSELHYRLLIEQSVDGIFVANQNGVYTDVNYAGSNMLGYTKEEIIGKTVADILEKEELPRLATLVSDHAAEGIVVTEWRFRRKDGSVFIGEVYGRMLPDGRLQGVLRDITYRREAEQKINNLNVELEEKVALRTEQLKKANEELEAFSYSVSHDLRAPLRAIIGFASILEEDYTSQLDAEAKRYTSIIKSNTLRMGNLVDDLLSFSRMSRHELNKTTINTNQMLKEVIAEVENNNENGKATWQVSNFPDVSGDPNTIRQVWVNLISNAFKYSRKTAEPVIEIGSIIKQTETIFFVRDNGVGFDEQYSNKLFKVFQRLHSAGEFEGTGVGLAIVEKIISKHDGKVWARSSPGNGACFYFSLPS